MSTSQGDHLGEVVEQTERIVRDAHERVEKSIPPTERISDPLADLFDEIGSVPRLPRIPDVPDVLDPWGVRHRVRRGVERVEDQLDPLRDRMDPVRDRIEELRRRPLPKADDGRGTETDDDGWGLIEWALFWLVLELLGDLELTLELDVDRALWSFDEEDDGRFDVWNKTVFVPPASFAARLGDPVMHGDVVAPGAGSPTVFIGGKPALRTCDVHTCTKATPVPHVGAGFRSTYGGVEIEGFPALRVGDYLDEGPHGLNPIVAGCLTVTIGPLAPPVECWSPGGEEPMRRPDLFPFRWRKGELGHFKGKVVLGVDIDGPFVRVDGTVTAARLWAEETKTHDIPLGDYDGDGKSEALRLTVESKSERVLGVSDVELDVHPLTRRVDAARITPRDRNEITPEKPEVKFSKEIVEVS